jgi:peptidoglycan hydrolase-like protein with peptidoglycan-binding domain
VGSTGSDVLELQQLLNQWGYTITDSGSGSPGHETDYLGSLTAKAVMKFQAANHISPVSGFVGAHTRAKLNSLIGTSGVAAAPAPAETAPSGAAGSITESLAPGESGAEVITLQKILVQDGDLSSDHITGYYGDLTEAAVKTFQIKHDIISYGTPDSTGYGAVGPRTRNQLNEL